MPDKALAILHAGTPEVVTASRVLRFLRTHERETARLLATRTLADPFTRTRRAFGARRLENPVTGNADALTTATLSGAALKLHTADGDVTFSLSDAAGRPLWSKNAQGTVSAVTYERQTSGGRPLAMTEHPVGDTSRVRECYTYAFPNDTQWKGKNLAGAITELKNNAGISRPLRATITGRVLQSEERLLKPEVGLPDWRTMTEVDTEAPLVVSGTYAATGAPQTATNAAHVTTVTMYDIAGAIRETRLQYQEGLAEQEADREVVILRNCLYRANGAVLSQTAGNGMVDAYEYDPRTQFLTRHATRRPADHPLGPLLIVDLHYEYEPVGNILTLEDKGASPQWHSNQEATGLRTYAYDTLNRLTTATGRERTTVARFGAQSANRTAPTPGNAWAPYKEQYSYDDGDNLTSIRHTGGGGNRTRQLIVAAGSNRAVVTDSGVTPETGFWVGGLQKQLVKGQALIWYADNQLQQVSPVVRMANKEEEDTERYYYADGGTRTRKIHTTKVAGGKQLTATTYAGGCELRQRLLSGEVAPQKHIVITEGDGVRLVEDRLSGNTHLRYSFSDHLGSICADADAQGRLVSREEYAPYGGTVGSDETAAEVSNLTQRTYRYSGKERDATGLYYYGCRYYMPESGRWLSADPGGLIDGVNLYRFNHNNSMRLVDTDGRHPVDSLSPVASTSERSQSSIPGKYTVEQKRHVVYRVDSRSLNEIVDAGGFSPNKDSISVVDDLAGKGFSTAITPHAALIWGGGIAESSTAYLYELTLDNTPAIYFDNQTDKRLVKMMSGNGFSEYMMRAEVFVTDTVPSKNIKLLHAYDKSEYYRETQSQQNGIKSTFQRTIEFFDSFNTSSYGTEKPKHQPGRLESAESIKAIGSLIDAYYAGLPHSLIPAPGNERSDQTLQLDTQRRESNESIASSVKHMVSQLERNKVSQRFHDVLRGVRHITRSCIRPRTSP